MNRWVKLQCGILTVCCQAAGLLPSRFLYGPLRGFLYWLIYHVAGYRIGVVRNNLRNSFPEKGAEELRAIEREYYKHLAELFIDTIDMTSITPGEILRRIEIKGFKEHEALNEGRDWIAAMSHYGSWEYFSAYALVGKVRTVGVYHPLKNKVFDLFFKKMRSRFGAEPVESKKLLRYIVRVRAESGRRVALGMIADQNMPRTSKCWFEFLNQPTPFYNGVGALAVKFGMPVYFLHLRKKAPARYEGWFEEIYDGKGGLTENEIMARYAALLQKDIRRQPAYWMWSHRRWKRPLDKGQTIVTLPEV